METFRSYGRLDFGWPLSLRISSIAVAFSYEQLYRTNFRANALWAPAPGNTAILSTLMILSLLWDDNLV